MANERSSSPLRHLDISDDKVASDIMAEKARELIAAYERIGELQDGLVELLWLIQFVADRDDLSPDVRDALTANPRIFDAQQLLA
jgi:hypothetical protein